MFQLSSFFGEFRCIQGASFPFSAMGGKEDEMSEENNSILCLE